MGDNKKINSTFLLNILASDKLFYSGPCEMLVFPALDGEQGVLPRHEATVTCTGEGELRYKVNGEWNYAAVGQGIVEIMPDFVTLLADSVEKPEEIDIRRAEQAEERARERLRQNQSIKEYYQTQAALNRALSRIKVSGRKLNI